MKYPKSITLLNVLNPCGKEMGGVMISITLRFVNLMVVIVVVVMWTNLFARNVNVKKVTTIKIIRLIFIKKTIFAVIDIIAQENEYLNALCNVALFTNGECDPENNKIECGFDGGDCVSVQGLNNHFFIIR